MTPANAFPPCLKQLKLGGSEREDKNSGLKNRLAITAEAWVPLWRRQDGVTGAALLLRTEAAVALCALLPHDGVSLCTVLCANHALVKAK